MAEIIDISKSREVNDEEVYIEIPKSKEFLEHALKLSEFIKELPLSAEENDNLIELLIENLDIAKKDAFNQGFDVGFNAAEYFKNTKY